GANHAETRWIVETLGHRQLARNLAGIAISVEMRIGRERSLAQPLLDPNATQNLHRIRHHLDAGSDARETHRLLVNLNANATAPQRRRHRQPPHTCTDPGDRQLLVALRTS